MSICDHAEWPQRIQRRIDQRGRRAGRARLADAFRAVWRHRAGGDRAVEFQVRDLVGARTA